MRPHLKNEYKSGLNAETWITTWRMKYCQLTLLQIFRLMCARASVRRTNVEHKKTGGSSPAHIYRVNLLNNEPFPHLKITEEPNIKIRVNQYLHTFRRANAKRKNYFLSFWWNNFIYNSSLRLLNDAQVENPAAKLVICVCVDSSILRNLDRAAIFIGLCMQILFGVRKLLNRITQTLYRVARDLMNWVSYIDNFHICIEYWN